MKRLLALFTALLTLAVSIPACATFSISISNIKVRAGEEVSVYYNLSEDAKATLRLLDETGAPVAVLFDEYQDNGYHEFIWNGLADGTALPSGAYDLELTQGDDVLRLKLVLETPAELLAAMPAADEPGPSVPAPEATEAPAITEPEAAASPVPETTEAPQQTGEVFTPAHRSEYKPDHDPEGCYWCPPMDITDEEAVWKMLTSPLYTLDEKQNKQVIIRAEPSEKSEGIGVVTGTSMGVHVLENRSDGWSLIECYSASFFDSKVKAWNQFVSGYVKTSLLQKKTPDQEYGIVIDKLTQKLYLFHEGHLLTTLAVSTGLYNERQPYNETRTGDFLLVSRIGHFKSDRMICRYGIRFDGGDFIHEVPHVKNADNTRNYKATEYKLGTRGSHGCIRVQRLTNADGINMEWLYNHVNVSSKNGTRMVIWEDFQGRQIPVPEDDTPLYYNPKGGSYYHCTDSCPGVLSQYLPLTPFTYGELDTGAFASLTPCPNCQPVRRKADIQAVNELHLKESPGMVADYHKK